MTPDVPTGERPPARPVYRRLAAVLAVLCCVLAGLFGWFLDDGRWVFVGLALFVAFVMWAIAATGYWPPRR
jgi:hypothetical protein